MESGFTSAPSKLLAQSRVEILFIKEIHHLFRAHGIPFAIVGGYAVALHGIVRGTFDLDIVTELSESNFLAIDSALRSIGMKPLIPVSASELFQNLEVVEAHSEFGAIPVLSIDSLIQMKSRANREQDLKDIAALEALKRGRH